MNKFKCECWSAYPVQISRLNIVDVKTVSLALAHSNKLSWMMICISIHSTCAFATFRGGPLRSEHVCLCNVYPRQFSHMHTSLPSSLIVAFHRQWLVTAWNHNSKGMSNRKSVGISTHIRHTTQHSNDSIRCTTCSASHCLLPIQLPHILFSLSSLPSPIFSSQLHSMFVCVCI